MVAQAGVAISIPPYRLAGLLRANMVRGLRGRRIRLWSQPPFLARRIHCLFLSYAIVIRRIRARRLLSVAGCRRGYDQASLAKTIGTGIEVASHDIRRSCMRYRGRTAGGNCVALGGGSKVGKGGRVGRGGCELW